ncbi:MAG: Holliday junction resolvase RuvX [Peptoniphilaceae bacterium]|uniref:Holliday junction resolvase RuvX n=1 Tax=Parvimonas sp. TaxID=1944660 RepID=UPI002600958C|nr:Holliday junction resolvase RuvX [Parvimonas sp.]MCI5997635.1 Holliday junction resolvase RuvX [Parvimonas sp.]MDD7765327.1 Holliday junction resolvase RuvX [Peptoniphilaceae bacterium]MDY3051246.1 Holliday junction resolvase RuvX [Parvimonas sp.]
MNRYMALDVGDRTIGIAISDPLFIMASGHSTIFREDLEKDLNNLKKIIIDEKIIKTIIGFPKNLNNTVGPQGEKVLNFVENFKNFLKDENIEMEIIMQDERLTTVSAERILIEGNMSRKKRKKVIDKVAATYILQSYLDRK